MSTRKARLLTRFDFTHLATTWKSDAGFAVASESARTTTALTRLQDAGISTIMPFKLRHYPIINRLAGTTKHQHPRRRCGFSRDYRQKSVLTSITPLLPPTKQPVWLKTAKHAPNQSLDAIQKMADAVNMKSAKPFKELAHSTESHQLYGHGDFRHCRTNQSLSLKRCCIEAARAETKVVALPSSPMKFALWPRALEIHRSDSRNCKNLNSGAQRAVQAANQGTAIAQSCVKFRSRCESGSRCIADSVKN